MARNHKKRPMQTLYGRAAYKINRCLIGVEVLGFCSAFICVILGCGCDKSTAAETPHPIPNIAKSLTIGDEHDVSNEYTAMPQGGAGRLVSAGNIQLALWEEYSTSRLVWTTVSFDGSVSEPLGNAFIDYQSSQIEADAQGGWMYTHYPQISERLLGVWTD